MDRKSHVKAGMLWFLLVVSLFSAAVISSDSQGFDVGIANVNELTNDPDSQLLFAVTDSFAYFISGDNNPLMSLFVGFSEQVDYLSYINMLDNGSIISESINLSNIILKEENSDGSVDVYYQIDDVTLHEESIVIYEDYDLSSYYEFDGNSENGILNITETILRYSLNNSVFNITGYDIEENKTFIVLLGDVQTENRITDGSKIDLKIPGIISLINLSLGNGINTSNLIYYLINLSSNISEYKLDKSLSGAMGENITENDSYVSYNVLYNDSRNDSDILGLYISLNDSNVSNGGIEDGILIDNNTGVVINNTVENVTEFLEDVIESLEDFTDIIDSPVEDNSSNIFEGLYRLTDKIEVLYGDISVSGLDYNENVFITRQITINNFGAENFLPNASIAMLGMDQFVIEDYDVISDGLIIDYYSEIIIPSNSTREISVLYKAEPITADVSCQPISLGDLVLPVESLVMSGEEILSEVIGTSCDMLMTYPVSGELNINATKLLGQSPVEAVLYVNGNAYAVENGSFLVNYSSSSILHIEALYEKVDEINKTNKGVFIDEIVEWEMYVGYSGLESRLSYITPPISRVDYEISDDENIIKKVTLSTEFDGVYDDVNVLIDVGNESDSYFVSPDLYSVEKNSTHIEVYVPELREYFEILVSVPISYDYESDVNEINDTVVNSSDVNDSNVNSSDVNDINVNSSDVNSNDDNNLDLINYTNITVGDTTYLYKEIIDYDIEEMVEDEILEIASSTFVGDFVFVNITNEPILLNDTLMINQTNLLNITNYSANKSNIIMALNVTKAEMNITKTKVNIIQHNARVGEAVKWSVTAVSNGSSVKLDVPEESEIVSALKISNDLEVNAVEEIKDKLLVETNNGYENLSKIQNKKDGLISKVISLASNIVVSSEIKENEDSNKTILITDLNKSDTVEVIYETEAPEIIEEIQYDDKKVLTIASDTHYVNVSTRTSIVPISFEDANAITIYWLINDTKVPIRNITKFDTNSDGLIVP